MAPASLLAHVATILLCLQPIAAADALAASAPRCEAGGAGGVPVLDGVADEGALAELLSQVPGQITAAAKAGTTLEQQRFALRAPDSLAKSVAGALGRRGEALRAVGSRRAMWRCFTCTAGASWSSQAWARRETGARHRASST